VDGPFRRVPGPHDRRVTNPLLAEAPIRSADELTARWATLLAPPVFGARSLWLIWLDADGRMLPVVLPVDDVPQVPDRVLTSGLLALHDAVAAEHLSGEGHLALALCRPGRPEINSDDDAWADALRLTLDERIDDTWSLHLAAGGGVVPLVGPPPFLWRSRLP
jgi:hypothetical protein